MKPYEVVRDRYLPPIFIIDLPFKLCNKTVSFVGSSVFPPNVPSLYIGCTSQGTLNRLLTTMFLFVSQSIEL